MGNGISKNIFNKWNSPGYSQDKARNFEPQRLRGANSQSLYHKKSLVFDSLNYTSDNITFEIVQNNGSTDTLGPYIIGLVTDNIIDITTDMNNIAGISANNKMTIYCFFHSMITL